MHHFSYRAKDMKNHSIEYNTAEQLAAFFDQHPAAVYDYLDGEFQIITISIMVGELRTPAENFKLILEAVALHREHSGKPVLRP